MTGGTQHKQRKGARQNGLESYHIACAAALRCCNPCLKGSMGRREGRDRGSFVGKKEPLFYETSQISPAPGLPRTCGGIGSANVWLMLPPGACRLHDIAGEMASVSALVAALNKGVCSLSFCRTGPVILDVQSLAEAGSPIVKSIVVGQRSQGIVACCMQPVAAAIPGNTKRLGIGTGSTTHLCGRFQEQKTTSQIAKGPCCGDANCSSSDNSDIDRRGGALHTSPS